MSLDTVKVYYALSLLFSKEQLEAPDFIRTLGPDTIKKAFRAKVVQCHPDLLHNLPEAFRSTRHNRFIRIQQAYEFLNVYMEAARARGEEPFRSGVQKKSAPDTAAPAKTSAKTPDKVIIAVGGAKGGIGKTVLSANISAGLASLGKKVVAIDLDLGGANLHLHLGIKFPSLTLQHYFKNGKPLDAICLDTPIKTLKMIAGDSSNLGMANIMENQKERLIRDLRELKADYVVVDLGGDTSYNMVDFFLAADERIAVTSPEPTSVLDVYNFIKVSLLRYLNKGIFGNVGKDETAVLDGQINRLKGLVFEATSTTSTRRVKRIDELVARARGQNERWGRFLQDRIDKFHPYLVVNMMEEDAKNNLSDRIADIARQNLAITMRPLPYVPFDGEVRKIVHYLIPVLLERPESRAGQSIFGLVRTLLEPHLSESQLCRLLENSADDKIAPAFLDYVHEGRSPRTGAEAHKAARAYATYR